MIREIHYPEDNGTKFDMFRYPAGEVQVRLIESIPHEDEIHVFANIRDGEIMGLAMLMDAIAWRYQTYLYLPYLPYARADRRFVWNDCNGLGVFAEVLRKIMRANTVITLDAHSKRAGEMIENLIDVSPMPFIQKTLDSFPCMEQTQILLPDKGAADRYNIKNALYCTKIRDAKTGKLTGFQVPKEKEFANADSILVVDDICDGGGTFIGIAKELEQYSIPLNLYVSHGIFSKGLEELFLYYDRIFTTDSFKPVKHKGLTIFPAREILLEAIRRENHV